MAPELDSLKAKKSAAQKKLDSVKKAIEELDVIIDAAKAKSDVHRSARNDVKDEADKINAVIEN